MGLVEFVILFALVALAVGIAITEHGKRKDMEVRADTALARYHRLAADSVLQAGRERLHDLEADSLRGRITAVEQRARDSIATLTRLFKAIDITADSALAQATTVRDSMGAYRDAYTNQRAATGRLLAAAALATDSVKRERDQLLANRQLEVDEARADRDRWKASADELARSVAELKGGGKFLGFIPKPPKWVAATVGCVVGGLVDSKDRARGCGLGGATAAVVTPTD